MDKKKLLKWLFDNVMPARTPEEWCEIFEIEIIDWDGWNDKPHDEVIGLDNFVIRLASCTIQDI